MRLLEPEADGEFSLTKDILYPWRPMWYFHTHGEKMKKRLVRFGDLRDGGGLTWNKLIAANHPRNCIDTPQVRLRVSNAKTRFYYYWGAPIPYSILLKAAFHLSIILFSSHKWQDWVSDYKTSAQVITNFYSSNVRGTQGDEDYLQSLHYYNFPTQCLQVVSPSFDRYVKR